MIVEILVKAKISLADGTEDPGNDDPLHSRMSDSATEAVRLALEHVEGEGFSHDMAEISSLEILKVVTHTAVRKPPPVTPGHTFVVGDRVAFAKTTKKGKSISVKRFEGVISAVSNRDKSRVRIKYGAGHHVWENTDEILLLKAST